jgi:hypothetical protein
VSLLERLGAFAREGTAKDSVAKRQRHHEDRSLADLAFDPDQGVSEIHLGVTTPRTILPKTRLSSIP